MRGCSCFGGDLFILHQSPLVQQTTKQLLFDPDSLVELITLLSVIESDRSVIARDAECWALIVHLVALVWSCWAFFFFFLVALAVNPVMYFFHLHLRPAA